jgi:glycosyltransferase involved in cell wall biosynthesis
MLSNQFPIKILYLTSHAPEGKDHGARLRARHVLRQLSRLANVRLVLAGAYEKYTGTPDPLPNPLRPCEIFDFQSWKVTGLANRIRYELGSGYLNTYGHRSTERDRHQLLQLIEDHDVVWIHGLRVANGFNIWKWPKTILDIDDIPSELCKTGMAHGKGLEARLRAFRKFHMWKRHEARIFERFEAMSVCSESDRAHFGNSNRVFVVPNGFDAPSEPPMRTPSNPVRIGFIGSLEYPPNANGLRWFLRDVWPVILKVAPHAILRLVGKCSNDLEWIQAPNVEGLGWVADTDSEMATWSMTVVPIHDGGGTRVKISHAFSRKCPVVSTQLGAYGYEVCNDRELLFANSAPDFAAACLRLMNDPVLQDRLANTAWDAFLEKWTWDATAPRLEKAIRFILGRKGVRL